MKVFITIKGVLALIGLVTLVLTDHNACRQGVIVEKEYVPVRVEMVDYYSLTLDAPMTRKREHSEQYVIELKTDSGICECTVGKKEYLNLSVGQLYIP